MKFCLLEERKLKRKPTDKEKFIDLAIKSHIGYLIGWAGSMRLHSEMNEFPELNKELNKWWKKEGKLKYAKEIKQAEKNLREYERQQEEERELDEDEIKTLREMIKEYKKRR